MGTEIEYTAYARKRLREREIPNAWVHEIIEQGTRYRDAQSGRFIAVDRRHYKGKERDIMVAFERDNRITVVTSSALKEGQKERRIQSGRWIPL